MSKKVYTLGTAIWLGLANQNKKGTPLCQKHGNMTPTKQDKREWKCSSCDLRILFIKKEITKGITTEL